MTTIGDLRSLGRARRAIVVADLVESVRHMHKHESEVITRWLRFVTTVRHGCIPHHGGLLVKSLGDGLLLSFNDAADAVQCARALAEAMAQDNHMQDDGICLELRMGIHVAEVVIDELDIYGSGVNLAARIAGIGQPGDIVLSAEARDQLLYGLDADVEDLGDCFVKHLDVPVRVWRVARTAATAPSARAAREPANRESVPSIAVMPVTRSGATSPESHAAGAIADELATVLAGCAGLAVIAKPTIAALAQRRVEHARIYDHLNIRHVVEVHCTLRADTLDCEVKLFGAAASGVVLERRLSERLDATREFASDKLLDAANAIIHAIACDGIANAPERRLPSIGSYSLLLSAIVDMHRMSRVDSDRARLEIEELLARHPRAPEPHAWAAKWHMLRVAQRWCADVEREAAEADFHVRRALDANPDHSLALAISGQIEAYQRGDLVQAETLLVRAVDLGPSEPLAWLFISNLRAHQGQGEAAVVAAARAMKLSPADPTRFLYEMFAAQAALCAGDYASAQAYSAASLRSNCMHLASYAPLIISSVLSGDLNRAHEAAAQYLQLFPSASAKLYSDRFRGPSAQGVLFAQTLREAGIPD